MTNDDLLYRNRLRLFALVQEVGSVRKACRLMGVHPSTYYRWRQQLLRSGPEMLRPRERRPPRMPNALSPMLEQRVLAFALAHPGCGPDRVSAELAREKWGGIRISPNGVWRVLKRHGLNTRSKRLGLVAGYAAPPEPQRPDPPPPAPHLQASRPGHRVQLDCFCIGRLFNKEGVVWQYTAVDVATAYAWAELHITPRNPAARWTSQLARRVAEDLATQDWRLEALMTDNGAEFCNDQFRNTLAELGVRQIRIRSGRPQTNGCVERAQQTILHECWKPAFARYLMPSLSGLRRDLDAYLKLYNTDRAHTGRRTNGRTPRQALTEAARWHQAP